ncbi:hypothetical protein ADINL_0082 [Nitrincola lacisaponensis]|uniref:HD-CE domain-containing protein n=1 Tax=Nitrincola lacisaponensis TaxID=267850 RepID=A0A063YAT2_9GAMM|nr:hypothetical protein [Nitrincola lacisaponensis]KDE41402.1 hypothetical protein ADINL_0082 [Nitrincola lacisaponensis]
MTESQLLPLECLLQSISPDATSFPSSENYFEKYIEILKQLRNQVYPNINAGLAALSSESGLYTDHSDKHFDEVVLYAGILVGLKKSVDINEVKENVKSHNWILTPYEVYILLLSIRLHDVGNIYGREMHEQNILQVIRRFSIPYLNEEKLEATMIASIAGAHGGKTPDGDKDKIGKLRQNESNGHIYDIDSKKIAAITRFADEICENRRRVEKSDALNIPVHNLVFHKYAKAIMGNSVKNNILYLNFQFHIGDLSKTYQIYGSVPNSDQKKLINVNLPDITLDRLKKAELERRYCNKFIPESAKVKEIHVEIEILENDIDEESFRHKSLGRINFTLKEEGYPLKEDLMFDENTTSFMSYKRLCDICTEGESIE